ncbi:sulfatase [Halobacteriaceae archaeon GCM10025711]
MTERPNVVLLVVDSLRADALSCYDGAFGVETPHFDSVAEAGVVFENAFTTGPFTPPAHGSLFSGQYPSQTGFQGPWPSMPADVPLLAESFADAGYHTYGIPGPAKMASPVGLARGFDDYYEVHEEMAERPSLRYVWQLLTDPLIRRDFLRLFVEGNDYFTRMKFDLLRRLADAPEPFFAMANVTTVHAPYDPPRPYKQAATPDLSRPRLPILEEFVEGSVSFDREGVREDRLLEAADGGTYKSGVGLRYFDDREFLDDAEFDVLRTWYGAALAFLDDVFGEFLAWLDREGLRENTVLVVTADHGEAFGEHGALEHAHFLYDEITHVPLVISGPGVPVGERRTDLVSLVDVYPTLCDLAGIDPPDTVAGRSVFGGEERDAVFMEEAVRPVDDVPDLPDVSEHAIHEFEVGRKSVRTDEYRYELRSDGEERLYALPGETLVEDPDPSVVDSLRERLLDALSPEFSEERDADAADYSPGVRRNLRDLGYL